MSTVDTDVILQSLRASVRKALDRKQRLGQYAIVSKGGKPTRLEPEDIRRLLAAEDSSAQTSKKPLIREIQTTRFAREHKGHGGSTQ